MTGITNSKDCVQNALTIPNIILKEDIYDHLISHRIFDLTRDMIHRSSLNYKKNEQDNIWMC